MNRRYRIDGSWQRFDGVLLAGSPLRLFRTTDAGTRVLARIERGEPVAPSSLVSRLLDAGAVHPAVERSAAFTGSDVTVVTPQLRTGPASVGADDGRVTVDDGSSPPLSGATLRLPATRGPAAARNAGRGVVDTDLIAFVDADVEITDGWLEPLLAHFDDPRVGLVAPRVTGERASPLDLGTDAARVRAGTRVSYVPGAAMVVRAAAFDEVGGFDPTLRFGEDVDFVWRLDDAGWQCRYDPAAAVWHEPRTSWRERLQQHAGYGTSAAPLALRHPGALSPVHMNGWTAASWALALFGQWVPAIALGAGSSVALVRKLPDVPPRAAMGLALRGHLLAGRQLASASRRVWWPMLVATAVLSRRSRWWLLLALVDKPRAAPTDLAYGWGVWAGMRRSRSWSPIAPRLSAWPGRQR